MNIKKYTSDEALAESAALQIKEIIDGAIKKHGVARVVFSTGASQFKLFEALLNSDIKWENVIGYHLDEYIDLPETHPASFRKYLKERFTTKVSLKQFYFVDGTKEKVDETIAFLNGELSENKIDLGLIGIGENAHIAFNDPPADFDTEEPYKVVNLSESCKQQQVNENWFESLETTPKQAITMTVKQILKCENIISFVPYRSKAEAIYNTITKSQTNEVPATILKTHKNWTLYVDDESGAKVEGYVK